MEINVDFMITSLMETLKYFNIKSYHKPSQLAKRASLSPEKQMEEVLSLYSDIIERLWRIAETISQITEAEEERVGTMYMGSSWEGTYLPEISEGFDAYVMEEDSQTEMENAVEAIDADSFDEIKDSKRLLKLLRTERVGYYLITWTDYGLQVKANHEEAKRRGKDTGIKPFDCESNEKMFSRGLFWYTEELEVNGKIIPCISPSVFRKAMLKKPPTSVQGFPVWFRMKDQNSPAITLLSEELQQNGKITKITVVDLVTCLRTTKPVLDQKWVEEKQNSSKWLNNEMLAKLQENKAFVVAKSWEKDQENNACWRISFSVVERQCIKFLPQEPKICVIILKAIRRKFLSEPKGLVTYHLKTVLFYHLDKVGSDWKTSERAQNILKLLGDLADALERRSLPLFFEPGINTLGGMEESCIAELETKTRQILASPGILLTRGVLFQSMDEGHMKENFQKGKEVEDVWFDEKPS